MRNQEVVLLLARILASCMPSNVTFISLEKLRNEVMLKLDFICFAFGSAVVPLYKWRGNVSQQGRTDLKSLKPTQTFYRT